MLLLLVVLEVEAELIYVICECGAKILLVPDIEEMSRSIVTHAKKHVKSEADPEKAETERCRIEDLLTERVLESVIACEI